jgi:hypothetical protein
MRDYHINSSAPGRSFGAICAFFQAFRAYPRTVAANSNYCITSHAGQRTRPSGCSEAPDCREPSRVSDETLRARTTCARKALILRRLAFKQASWTLRPGSYSRVALWWRHLCAALHHFLLHPEPAFREMAGGDTDDTDAVAEPAVAYGAQPVSRLLTADEYLEFAQTTALRHEFVAGTLYAMSGCSRSHNRSAVNLVAASHVHLRGGPCSTFSSDLN